ncbi:hypothetical protein PC116_g20659 [Phytophthora cactorum]|nr:hypothetical protein PC128_g15278 [Phytophthora cactorum]KAG4231062.1 hypothetical protein PC116_g20659 [Phytophthora cactorum]
MRAWKRKTERAPGHARRSGDRSGDPQYFDRIGSIRIEDNGAHTLEVGLGTQRDYSPRVTRNDKLARYPRASY